MKEIEVTCKLGKELTADEIQTAEGSWRFAKDEISDQIPYPETFN